VVTEPSRFRFRPRFKALVATSGVLGLVAIALALFGLVGEARGVVLVLGAGAVLLVPLYAASPAWRLAVVVDDAGLAVERGTRVRLRLAWPDVVRVIWSPSTTTLFVDGGEPALSLLVPGPGAPAPYDLEAKPALCRAILARVGAERVVEVESLERFAAERAA